MVKHMGISRAQLAVNHSICCMDESSTGYNVKVKNLNLSKKWREMFSWYVINSNVGSNLLGKTGKLFHDMVTKYVSQLVGDLNCEAIQLRRDSYCPKATDEASSAWSMDSKWDAMMYPMRRVILKVGKIPCVFSSSILAWKLCYEYQSFHWIKKKTQERISVQCKPPTCSTVYAT